MPPIVPSLEKIFRISLRFNSLFLSMQYLFPNSTNIYMGPVIERRRRVESIGQHVCAYVCPLGKSFTKALIIVVSSSFVIMSVFAGVVVVVSIEHVA